MLIKLFSFNNISANCNFENHTGDGTVWGDCECSDHSTKPYGFECKAKVGEKRDSGVLWEGGETP